MVFHHHSPLTTVYNDNYRYGSSLYTPEMNDVERQYRNTLSRTHVRSDRGDLGMYSFAGSHIHGGRPASEKILSLKTKGIITQNLYSPLSDTSYGRGYYDSLRATTAEPRKKTTFKSSLSEESGDLYRGGEICYGPGYYDHLRAVSPVRKTRNIRSSALLDESEYALSSKGLFETGYKTLPTRFSDIDNDLTSMKRTTSHETWVPLTTYIYNTPFHTYHYKATPYSSYTYRTADDLYNYNYVDDYKRYATTTTKTTKKNVEDYSMTSKFDYSSYVDKCSKIQSQLDEVNRWVSEAESKIKSEVVTSRNSLQGELAEVASIVNDTAKYNDELHRAIMKQSKQISTLSSQYENVNRNISDVLSTLEKSQARCQTLQSDLSSMQSTYQTMSQKTTYPETTTTYSYKIIST